MRAAVTANRKGCHFMSEKKMRVTYRCSRSGSAKHNEHHHIETERRDVLVFDGMKNGPGTIEEKEIRFYEQILGPGIDERNDRYRAQRHPEKCRSAEQLYRNKNTKPEEFLLQIGDKDQSVSREVFDVCIVKFFRWLNSWNRAHGKPFRFLDGTFHYDETTLHYHGRRIWVYEDEKGYLRLGQEEALRRAGVELPEPDEEESRKNNRKKTFDSMCRAMWQDICLAHGLDIETEPLPGRRHKGTEEFIDDQIEKKAERLEQLESAEESAKARLNALKEFQRSAEAEAARDEAKAQEANHRADEALKTALEAEERARNARLRAQNEDACYREKIAEAEAAEKEAERLNDEIAKIETAKRIALKELASINAELEYARAEKAAKEETARAKAEKLKKEMGIIR